MQVTGGVTIMGIADYHRQPALQSKCLLKI